MPWPNLRKSFMILLVPAYNTYLKKTEDRWQSWLCIWNKRFYILVYLIDFDGLIFTQFHDNITIDTWIMTEWPSKGIKSYLYAVSR